MIVTTCPSVYCLPFAQIIAEESVRTPGSWKNKKIHQHLYLPLWDVRLVYTGFPTAIANKPSISLHIRLSFMVD
jgi:hypothetical protein